MSGTGKSQWKQEAIATFSTVMLELLSSGDGRESEEDEVATSHGEAAFSKCCRATKNVATSQLTTSCDRTKVTDRSATCVLTEMVCSTGKNPKEYNI